MSSYYSHSFYSSLNIIFSLCQYFHLLNLIFSIFSKRIQFPSKRKLSVHFLKIKMVHNPNSTKARKAYVCCAVSVREIVQKYFFLPLFFLFSPPTHNTQQQQQVEKKAQKGKKNIQN